MRLKTQLASLIGRHLRVRPARLAGHRPVASISFDDFPKSAWTLGGQVLARHGVHGTYYTGGSFCGQTVEGTRFYDAQDLTELVAAGHEIGCHGFVHRPVSELSSAELAQDAARNQEFLKPFLNGAAPVSYAYPFGRVSPRSKHFQAPRFSSLRGTHEGINIGRVDLAQLSVISLETRLWDEGRIQDAILRTLHDHGWLILYTHGVSDNPGLYGSTPQMLDWALSRLKAARIDVLPVKDALPVALGH
ncbi:MAG: polysaccharide deacetylase family protein [Pseudomonadota bacterium]